MKKRFFISSTFLRVIFFMFLIISVSKKINAQCITPSNTTICYGDSTNLCVSINNNASSFMYTQDFEGAISSEWDTSSTVNINSTTVLGNFDNASVTFSLNALPTHDSITIEFDLYVIASWDGNSLLDGPDFFTLRTDGVDMMHTTFSNVVQYLQSYPEDHPANYSPQTGAFIVSNVPSFALYKISKTIAHVNTNVVIDFIGGPGLENIGLPGQESWAIDNVSLEAFNYSTTPTVTWTNITNNSFISSDTCITVNPITTTEYQVVIDSTGTLLCVDTIQISVNPEINITAVVNNNSSQNACNGQIFLNVTGGSGAPYTFNWDTSGVSFPAPIPTALQALCENTYCLTVTDNSGCTTDTCFNVEWNPCQLTDSIITPILCNGGSGTVQLTLDTIAGTGPIPYSPFLPRFIVNTYSVNPYVLVNTIQTNAITIFITPLFANDYIISVYDRSWADSCYTTVTLTEPDPIVIYTSVTNTSFPYQNDGTINIDSITGGTEPYVSIDWFDNSVFPPVLIATGDTMVDSLFYANAYTGGYQISVMDTNGCETDTIIYVHPDGADATLGVGSVDSIPPTCFNSCDAEYLVQMFNVGTYSVPPFTYVWTDLINGTILRVDTLGSPFYNPNTHNGSYSGFCEGVYSLQISDYYGNGPLTHEFVILDPVPVQVDLGPDFIIPCGEDTVLSVVPTGGNIINDTILIDTQILSFSTNNSAFTDSLSAGKEYLLVVSGTYQNAQGDVFDAAYNTATQSPVMDWILGAGQTQRPTPDIYQPSNIYNFVFSGFNGVQQVVLPGGNTFFGTLTFQLYEISIDTTIYSYSWTTNPPGGPNPPVISNADTVLAYPGVNGTDYFVTVSDQNGCSTTDTINVSWDLFILNIDTISTSNVGCNGQATGYIAVVVDTNFGFSPYTYFLNDNITNDTSFNLSAGIYIVSISDDVGCLSDTSIVQIFENDSLYACIDPINFVSELVDNFSLTFDTASSYTTVQTQLGLQYELIVSGTYYDTLWSPYQDAAYRFLPTVVAHTTNPWSWNGTFNARPDLDTYNNTHTYSYSFTGTGNTQVFSYTDIHGDYFGSNGQLNFELYKYVCPESDTAYTCYGDSTGFATIYPNGGVPFTDAFGNPYYMYEWKDNLGNIVNTNATATGLSAGSYTVTVIDAIDCTYDRDLIVVEPTSPLEIDTNSFSIDVTCHGEETSYIEVYNSGGFQPYLCVLIFNGGTFTDTVEIQSGLGLDTIVFDSLAFGTYYYYLYDSVPDNLYGDYMCQQMMEFNITEPSELLSSTSLINNVICWGAPSGQASVSAIGGITPYTYQWHNAPFGPDSLGEEGQIADSLWADTLLPFPGATWNYVTVTDANGCERTDSVEIMHMYEKIQPLINMIEDSVTCYGDCDGAAALSSIGGVLPHLYTWDILEPGNSGLNHASLNQPDTVDYLCEGGHAILIVDDEGCEAVVTFRIYQPDPIYAIGTLTTPISCFGYNDGSAQVYGIGGNIIPPSIYTYSWQLDTTIYSSLEDSLFWAADTNNLGQSLNNQSAQYTDSILPPGNHIVTVTDYKGCSASDTVQFIEPALLTLEFTDTVYAYCDFTESASLCVQAYGGTVNYTYQFNDHYHQNNTGSGTGSNNPFCANNLTPANTNTAPGIPIDDYYVTVIDERGCFADNYINIDSVTNNFNVDSVDYVWQNVSCFNGSNGSIDINDITGGMGSFPSGYTIAWTGPNGYSNTLFNISSLEAGSYAATISDSAVGGGPSCDITINVLITEPEQLLVSIYDTTGATCIGDGYLIPPQTPTNQGSGDGQIMVTITGGTGPYSYDFDEQGVYPLVNTVPIPSPGDTLIDNLYSGNHTIYITDANNCVGSPAPGGIATATIDIGVLVTVNVTAVQPASCADTSDGSAIVDIPNSIFNYTWQTNNPGWPFGFPAGDEPSGTILGTTTSYSSFYPDNYWLVAHYAPASNFGIPIPGCDATAPFTITSPSPIVPNFVITEPDCWGDNNGSILIQPINGGNGGPYTFDWDTTISTPNGSSANPLPNLLSGTYTVTITDVNGCETTDAIFVDQPEQIQNNFIITDVSCEGLSDGEIEAITSGGVGTISYTWTQGSPTVTGSSTWDASAGTYIVTIEDGNGCSIEDITTVGEPNELSVTLSSNINYGAFHVSCNGTSDGEILATVLGGTSPFTYAWSNTQSTNPAINVPVGPLSVIVTDANGCSDNSSITLLEPNPIEDNASVFVHLPWGNNVSCFGGSDGQISLLPTGGIPDNNGEYTYTWTPSVSHPVNNNGSIAINLSTPDPSGTIAAYEVIVEALYGCNSTFSYPLTSPSEPFNATVNTVNYAGPGNTPYSIDFQDLTTNSAGIPITNLNHLWCWDYTIEWNSNMQAYYPICNSPTDLYTGSGQALFSHPFSNIGVNDVFVIVTNNETGCTDTTYFTIEVQGIPEINNVFSPNGDGINDVFSIGEFGMDNMSVSIFNRWGEQVYSWEGDAGEWDGKGTDGQTLSEGVYFYVLKATGMDGYYYERKGSITLIR